MSEKRLVSSDVSFLPWSPYPLKWKLQTNMSMEVAACEKVVTSCFGGNCLLNHCTAWCTWPP